MNAATQKKKNAPVAGRKRVTFQYQTTPGSEVYIAGDFNDWDPKKRKMTDKENNGVFTTTMMLPPGEYAYKFIVNGKWTIDPACEGWVPNSMGSLNSLMKI